VAAGGWKRATLAIEDAGANVRLRLLLLPPEVAPPATMSKASLSYRLIERLAEPRSDEELAREFPGGNLPRKLRTLSRRGLILRRDEDEREHLLQRFAAHLPRISAAVANDLLAFGAALFAGGRREVGEEVARDLATVSALLAGIDARLRRERQPYLQEQCSRLGVAERAGELRLNLGGREQPFPEWINVDLLPSDLRLNLRWGLPLPEGSVRYAYASHVLEHLYPHEAEALLDEIRRVLRPEGVLRVVVPDIGACIAAYCADDRAFFERRVELWPWAASCTTRLEHFLAYAGAGADPGDVAGHKYGYDFETLAALLRRAGFRSIAQSSFGASRHPPLRIDDPRGTAGFTHGQGHFSLFVEAGP
jgi:SAM-dependent methyltransferase